jgi:hypothetical protein
MRATLYVQTARPRTIVVLGAGTHLPAPIPQTLHTRRGRRFEQSRLRRGIGDGGRGDLLRLYLREPPSAKRGVGLRQLVERPRRLECASRGADRLPRRFGDPVRGAAMPTHAPQTRFVHASRQHRLRSCAHPLAPPEEIEKIRRVAPFETTRIQVARGCFDCSDSGADLLEHASSRAQNRRLGEVSGSVYEHMFASSTPIGNEEAAYFLDRVVLAGPQDGDAHRRRTGR